MNFSWKGSYKGSEIISQKNKLKYTLSIWICAQGVLLGYFVMNLFMYTYMYML